MSEHPYARMGIVATRKVAPELLDFMSDPEDREDKQAILGMLYGEGLSTRVTYRDVDSDVVHAVLAGMSGIGITWCGDRIIRRTMGRWTPDDRPPTCFACLAEDRDE